MLTVLSSWDNLVNTQKRLQSINTLALDLRESVFFVNKLLDVSMNWKVDDQRDRVIYTLFYS